MDLKTLADNFGTIVDDPNGISRIRQLVIDSAITGRLGSSKKTNPIVFAEEAKSRSIQEQPEERRTPPKALFRIPTSWQWMQLENLCADFDYGTSTKAHSHESGVPILRMNNIKDGEVILDSLKYVDNSIDDLPKLFLRQNDLLFNRTNSYDLVGKVAVFKEKSLTFTFASYLIRFRCGPNVDPNFVSLYFRSTYCRKFQIEPHITRQTNQANFNGTKLKAIWIPTPPLKAQRVILALFDQLMALCDQLERKKEKVGRARLKLNSSWLEKLVSSQNAEELQENWGRVRDAFPVLITETSDLERLRHSIRTLAVTGALSPCKPYKENAFGLLKRISEEQGTDLDGFPTIKSNHAPPCLLPESWSWARFDQVATIASNLVDPAGFRTLPHVAPDSIEKHTGRLLSYNTVGEDGVTSSKHKFYTGQILYSKIRPNLGKAVLIEFDGLCSADMYPINAFINKEYLLLFILSTVFLKMAIHKDTRVAMPKINQTELNQILVSVPPLEEQETIVEKVKLLFAVCNELELVLKNRMDLSTKLTFALSKLPKYTQLDIPDTINELLSPSSSNIVNGTVKAPKEMVAAQ